MRILHAIHSLSPEGGGPAEGLRRLAQTARSAKIYETEVVCLDAPSQAFLASEGLLAHPVGPGLGKYGYTRAIDRWFEQNLDRFDGVVINGLWQYHAYAAWKACRGRKPYLLFTHGMLDPWFKRAYPMKHIKKAIYWGLIEHRILRDAKGVLFTASLEAELAKQTFWPNQWTSVVVPYGTVEPPGGRNRQVAQFRTVCPQVKGRKFILFLGRLHEKKGCDLLIEAFARQASAYPDTDLVLAGPDQQGSKAKLASMVARRGLRSRVHFPGMLQDAAKWGAFYSAEVFTLPSHQENFGIAVAEALACGTPVLISDKVNIWREIVEDGVGLVDDDTLEGTSRLLDRWHRLSAVEREEMAARCQSSFERRFDIKQAPKVIAGLFSEKFEGRLSRSTV